MAELFATTLDIYLVLGDIAEEPSNHDTADGRPATRFAAEARLARMLGADLETSTADDREHLAKRAFLKQAHTVGTALAAIAGSLPDSPQTIVLAGDGEFLARTALTQAPSAKRGHLVSLKAQLGAPLSQSACAYAVAVLASEENG